MSNLITIDPAIDILSDTPGVVRILTPDELITIADPHNLVSKVLDMCGTSASYDAITEAFDDVDERVAACTLIEDLLARRVLTRSSDHGRRDPLRDWLRHRGGATPRDLPSLDLQGSGHLAAALREGLGEAEFSFAPAYDADCIVCALDTADFASMRAMNERAVTQSKTFFPVWLNRGAGNWGPVVVPGTTACLECLWHRQQACRTYDAQHYSAISSPTTASRILARTVAGFAVSELLRWASNANRDEDVGANWQIDFLRLEFCGGRVPILPRCPVCGPLA